MSESNVLQFGIDPLKWYCVKEIAGKTGWGVDTVRRWIRRGLLQAFRGPSNKRRGLRQFYCERVIGSELIRFINANLTPRK